jgi:carbon monoxide dehydrogenase subunit G
MKIEGVFTVPAPIDQVWTALLDPAVIGPCIPGCGAIEVLSPTEYRATVRVEVGPIKTSFNAIVSVTEMAEREFVASLTRGEEGSRASMLSARNMLRVRALAPDSTEIGYESEVSVTGRLGKFGLGIMKKKAADLAGKFADALRDRLTAPAASETR